MFASLRNIVPPHASVTSKWLFSYPRRARGVRVLSCSHGASGCGRCVLFAALLLHGMALLFMAAPLASAQSVDPTLTAESETSLAAVESAPDAAVTVGDREWLATAMLYVGVTVVCVAGFTLIFIKCWRDVDQALPEPGAPGGTEAAPQT